MDKFKLMYWIMNKYGEQEFEAMRKAIIISAYA
jgi:hypothetical protein